MADGEVPCGAVRVRDHAAHAGDGVLSLREGLVVRWLKRLEGRERGGLKMGKMVVRY